MARDVLGRPHERRHRWPAIDGGGRRESAFRIFDKVGNKIEKFRRFCLKHFEKSLDGMLSKTITTAYLVV